ncbi:MAG: HEAT repeat domain-containing protein [Desulfobulbaceae bacterium]|nr:HEAT repeat domain-containing protein [Desulfobulbaceae bacterium]
MKASRSNTEQQLLEPSDISSKIQTILALRKQASQEGIQRLAEFVEDSSTVVQTEAIDALGNIALNSNQTNSVFRILKAKATDTNFASRGQALITASMLERDSLILPVIENYISESQEEQIGYAVKAMSFIETPNCIPLLQKVLEVNDDNNIERNAFIILGKINTPEAKTIIRDAVFSIDADTQLNSTWAISRLNNDEYIPILIDAIEQDELYKDALGSIATSLAAPKVFGTLFQREDIHRERKVGWQKIFAQNLAGTPRNLQEQISEATERFVPPLPTSNTETPQEIESDTKEQMDSDNPEENESQKNYTYKNLASVFNDPDPYERRSAWLVYKRYADFSDPADLEKIRQATENADPVIREDAKKILAKIAN